MEGISPAGGGRGGEDSSSVDGRGEGLSPGSREDLQLGNVAAPSSAVFASRMQEGRGEAEKGLQSTPESGTEDGSKRDVDWPAVLARGKTRGEESCPICIGGLGRRGSAGVAWLSCSHQFHVTCIKAFEAFELANGNTPSCPVCRLQGYQRRCFE